MKTIFYVSSNALGFALPLISSAIELKSMHPEQRVIFITSSTYKEYIESGGIEYSNLNMEDEYFNIEYWHNSEKCVTFFNHLQSYIIDAAIIVTHELLHAPLIYANKHNIECAVLGLGTWVGSNRENLDCIADPKNAATWYSNSIVDVYNVIAASVDAPPIDQDSVLTFPIDLCSAYFIRSIPEIEKGSLPESNKLLLIGDCIQDDPYQKSVFDEIPFCSEKPIVILLLGRQFAEEEGAHKIISALGDLDARIIYSQSQYDQDFALPENFVRADLIDLNSHRNSIACVISNGHTTSALLALSSGVPALFLPNGSRTDIIARKYSRFSCYDYQDDVNSYFETIHTFFNKTCIDEHVRSEAQALKLSAGRLIGRRLISQRVYELAINSSSKASYLDSYGY